MRYRKGGTMGVLTRRWMGKLMCVAALLLVALTLSACIESSTASTIGSDLTGTTKVRVGISKVALQAITGIGKGLGGTPTPSSGGPSSDNPFAGLNAQVTARGGTARRYETADFMGVEITFLFKSLD